jgi:cysteine synthase A
MNRIKELEKLIGNTPLIKIKYKYNNKIRNIYAKLEWYSLTGSTKDRVALNIIKNAYKNKELLPHQPIIETTSGNMGISFSAIGAYLKHPVTIFMPKFMSTERINLIKLYGANLILCNSFEDCFLQSKDYANKVNGYLCKQFENKYNMFGHYNTTAQEIARKIKAPKCFVAGVGTSGT